MLIFDIDHFKRINDTYGHQVGDQVIRKVSTTARVQIRAEDLVGRIGGEEFVCILSGVEGGEARVLAERLCSSIAEATARDGPGSRSASDWRCCAKATASKR